MITVDAPISFLVGSSLAYCARKKNGDGLAKRNHVLARGLMVQSMILMPLILFFMVRFPDWEWNYLFNAQELFFTQSSLAVGLFCLITVLMNASFVLGFVLSERMIANGNASGVPKLLAAIAGLIGVIIAVFWRETLYVGTMEEFMNESASLIFFEPGFMIAQAIAGPLLVAGFLWALRPTGFGKGAKATAVALAAVLSLSACDQNASAQVTNITPAELSAMGDDVYVLDVRTPGEVADGVIASTDGIADIRSFDANLAALANKPAKDQKIVVYCRSGGRSAKAAQMLVDKGYTNVHNMLGGITRYQSEGLPTKAWRP